MDFAKMSKRKLYQRARELNIHGRSKMDRDELIAAIRERTEETLAIVEATEPTAAPTAVEYDPHPLAESIARAEEVLARGVPNDPKQVNTFIRKVQDVMNLRLPKKVRHQLRRRFDRLRLQMLRQAGATC